jgi:hypothetical protein
MDHDKGISTYIKYIEAGDAWGYIGPEELDSRHLIRIFRITYIPGNALGDYLAVGTFEIPIPIFYVEGYPGGTFTTGWIPNGIRMELGNPLLWENGGSSGTLIVDYNVDEVPYKNYFVEADDFEFLPFGI